VTFFKKYIKENQKLRTFIVILMLLGISIVIILVSIVQISPWLLKKMDGSIDSNYTQQYEAFMKMDAAKEINTVLYETDKIKDTTGKLNNLAKWETDNFTSLYWGNSINTSSSPSGYYTYDNGKTRAYVGLFGVSASLRDDPYFIAYQKAGECEEKAVLFNELASRAGFITRLVGYPNRHEWTEVKINGTWWYFDSDCYHYFVKDPANTTRWFNQTKFYRQNCLNFPDSSVLVQKTGEDISAAYIEPIITPDRVVKDNIFLPNKTKISNY
jgi:hypothetical protein